MNPDTCERGDPIRIRICVDAETFKSEKNSLGIQKYLDKCGRGLKDVRFLKEDAFPCCSHTLYYLVLCIIALYLHLVLDKQQMQKLSSP